MVRDRDETETFDFQSETRSRPRPSHVSTRPRRDRDFWKLRLETVSRPRLHPCLKGMGFWRMGFFNWKRPPGRHRITWLNTVQRDLRAYNLACIPSGLVTVCRPCLRTIFTFCELLIFSTLRSAAIKRVFSKQFPWFRKCCSVSVPRR